MNDTYIIRFHCRGDVLRYAQDRDASKDRTWFAWRLDEARRFDTAAEAQKWLDDRADQLAGLFFIKRSRVLTARDAADQERNGTWNICGVPVGKPSIIHPDHQPVGRFTEAQLAALRRRFGAFEKVDPCSDTWKALCEFVEGLSVDLRRQLAESGIKWLSYVAKRSLPREPRLVPACGGTETPVTVNGKRYLYCWDCNATGTFRGDHVYVDLSTDIPLTPAEEDALFNPGGAQ